MKFLQAYTPTIFNLDYDSLRAQVGCETETGTDYFNWIAFNEICISEFDENDRLFGQPENVSYSVGPQTQGVGDEPYKTGWSAWVADAGIRIGKVGTVTPPSNTIGAESALYPTATPDKLTHAFGAEGLLAIAIQKDTNLIELKRYTDTSGAIATTEYTGFSPILWYSGLLDTADDPNSGLVLFYLKSERPSQLFARFQLEGFATERIVIADLRTPLKRLISTFAWGRQQYLLAIDKYDRAVTLKSPIYPVRMNDRNAMGLGVFFSDGIVLDQAVEMDIGYQKCTLATSFHNGYVYAAIVEPSPQPPNEKATLAIAFENGDYET